LLVETPVDETEGDAGMPQIMGSINYIVDHHLAQVISLSLGVSEPTLTRKQLRSLRRAFENASSHGVTVVAASGDLGVAGYRLDGTKLFKHQVADWPASDPLVTAVGGTTLYLRSDGQRRSPDTAWNDGSNLVQQLTSGGLAFATGGGKSGFFSRPAFQNRVSKVVGRHRGEPDIAMSASCRAGVDIYTKELSGWNVVCGTSEATPLFAGVVAIADEAAKHSLGWLNPALYSMMGTKNSGLIPITAGNNGVNISSHGQSISLSGYSAKAPYSLATGLGTLWAPKFVPALVKAVAVTH